MSNTSKKSTRTKRAGTKQNSNKKGKRFMNAAYLVPAITLFNEDGTLDLVSQERLYNNLIENGVDGILGEGSSSEFFAMNMEQRREMARFAIEKVDHRVKLIIGTSSMVADEIVSFSNYCLDAGADACFITFPGSIRGMKEWRHRIHGPVVTTPIKYEDSIDQETEAGACMSVYWPNTIYAAFTAVRDTLKKFAETRDMTKVDAKFDEDELLKLLPLQKYYDQMDKYHGEKQYLR